MGDNGKHVSSTRLEIMKPTSTDKQNGVQGNSIIDLIS